MTRATPLTALAALAAAAAAGTWLAAAPPAAAQHGGHGNQGGPWTPQRAAKAYNHNCRKCHTAPDPDFATDLAWLDQINRTS